MFDLTKYRYPSRRSVVLASKAMACTSVPLAPQIGLDVMKQGGNAVDAAVAMAAAMPLLEPGSNGLGSDAFALVWIEKEKKLYGLNASGYSPRRLSAEAVRAAGNKTVPFFGWFSVTVPGAAAGWKELNRRFGKKPLRELFRPAISYAEEGYPVPVTSAALLSEYHKGMLPHLEANPELFGPWAKEFLKENGEPYRCGEVFKSPNMAKTYRELAETDCDSLYHGRLMKEIVDFSKRTGGFFEEEDFISYKPDWVEPISSDYKGYTVWEMPPNGNGITVLMALNILRGLKLPEDRDSAEFYHLLVESIKLAFADSNHFVSDPRFMQVSTDQLLSESYAASRRALIRESAQTPTAGDPFCGGTIYLCTADPEGNMVSYIQSNYKRFGSGIVVPGTGIALQNRGANFSLEEGAANCLAGGKRAYHTIIPGFLSKAGEAVGPFGVMGAFMQPQGQVQVLLNAIDYHMNPQQCLDAPRVQWVSGKKIQLEAGADPKLAEALRARGHEVEILSSSINMGRGEIIWRLENGVLAGACEPRGDAQVAAW